MIPLQNRFSDALTALFSSRKFSRRSLTARRRFAVLRAVTARQRFGLASRAAALFGTGTLILLGSQSKSLAQATVPTDTQFQYKNSTGVFSTGFTPTLAGGTTAELNFGGTGPYTATDDLATLSVNDLSFFNSGLVSIVSSSPTNVITLAGTTPQIFIGSNGSALIDVILAGTAGLVKSGASTLTLGAANTYTGATTLNQGTLALDFTQAGAPTTNILAATSTLRLNGGTLQIIGAAGGSTQTFANTAFTGATGGTSIISAAPVTGGTIPIVNLGTLTGTQGALLRFDGAASNSGASSGTTVGAATPIAATATFNLTTATLNGGLISSTTVVTGAQSFATVGLYDWAAVSTAAAGTAQTGTVVGLSQISGGYTIANGNLTQGGSGQNVDLTASGTFGNNSTSTGASYQTIRFNTNAALTLTTGRAFSENIVGGLLVTPNVGAFNTSIVEQTGTNAQGFQSSRSTGGATGLTIWQNNTQGELVITAVYTNGSNSAANGSYTQGGLGTVVLTPTVSGAASVNGYTGLTYLDGGTTVIPSDAAIGNPATAAVVNINGGTLFGNATFALDNAGANLRPVFLGSTGGTLAASTGNTFTISGVVSGAGDLRIGTGTLAGTGAGTANTTATIGSGTVVLSNAANSYTGTTFLNAGTLQLTGAIGQLGVGGGVTFNGGTFQYANGATADISTRTVTLASGGGTIDTNSSVVTLAGSIGNGGTGSLTKAGLGTLTLGGANLYSGGTIVNGGSLLIANATGSGTGTGNVTVNSGGTFGGTGTSTGSTTVNGGGILSSNTSVPATLTLGNLTLADQSITNFGFGASGNATITVTGALSLNGTDNVNLYQIGTTSTFATAGTYNLFTEGSLTGSVSSLAVNNPAPNTTYAFNLVGNVVRLTISGGVVSSAWNVDSNGFYSVPSNWTNGVPNTAGAQAIFGTVITAPRTVTVDGTFTVGEIDLNNANAYTLTPGAAGNGFVFNNNGNNGIISDINGSHTIAAPLALGLGLNVSVANGTDTLTLSGAISNTGAAGTGTLSKTGAGTLALLGNNTFDGGVTISNGKVQVNSVASLGAVASTATLDSSANVVTLEALNSITTARNFAINGTNSNFQVDAGATYEIDGVIAVGATSAGTLTKTGPGTLALGNANTYPGITTISAGTLSLVNAAGGGGTGGSLGAGIGAGMIVDNAALVFNRTDSFTLANIISGTGTVTQAGAGNTTLTSANTFSGLTTITGGTLTLGNALALQNSTLNYDNLGGTFSFGTQTAATLGGLTGAQSLALTNTAATPAAVALTINNALANTYTGTLSGLGSLTKNGAGAFTIGSGGAGGATYTGITTVNQGTMIFGNNTSLTGQLSITGQNGTSAVTFQDNSVLNSTATLFVIGLGTNGNPFPATLLVKNSASVTAANISFGNNSTGVGPRPTGDVITVQDTASLTANGFFDFVNTNGGTGTASTTTTNLNGGTLAVQRFQLTNPGGSANTLATFRLNGGTLTALANDTSGTVFFLPAIAKLVVDVDSGGAFVNTNGFNVTFAQPLVHGLGTPDGGLTKNGAGTLTLTAGNSYTGITTINAGTLNINGQFALGGAVYGGTTFNGGTLQYATAFTGNGTGDISQNSTNVAKPVTFTSTATIDVNGNAVTYANPVGNGGAGGLTVTSTASGGSLTLAGVNTYTGATTVNSGALFVNGSVGAAGTPSGAVTVASGATLGGAGTLTVASASVAGTLSPGAVAGATTGALTLNTTSALTLSGTLVISLNSTSGVSSGTVLNTGALALSGATLSLIGTAADGTTTYDLVNYSSALTGTFANANIPAGYTINYAGTTFSASDIELDPMSAVPEPSTWLAGFLLVGAVGYKRRKRIGSLFAA